MIVEVSVPIPVQSEFDYRAGDFASHIQIGMRVYIPFGRKNIIGFVVGIKTTSDFHTLKYIHSLLDKEPVLTSEQLAFAEWMSSYYQASLGEVLQAFFPLSLTTKEDEYITIIKEPDNELLWDHQLLIWFKEQKTWEKKALQHVYNGTISFATALQHLLNDGTLSEKKEIQQTHKRAIYKYFYVLNDLTKLDNLKLTTDNQRNAKEFVLKNISSFVSGLESDIVTKENGISKSVIQKLVDHDVLKIEKRETLHYEKVSSKPNKSFVFTEEQVTAWNDIQQHIHKGGYQPMLLFGITGSGKTLLYIEALKEILSQGKSGIILVPEISLTPQTLARFQEHFGEKIGIIHSKKSESERYLTWRKILTGEIRIVIGPRSALFSPVQNLGLIIVDEEHESSYKQFEPAPRYHARDSAIYRAYMNKCPIILGSATPSFESFTQAKNGKYHLITLKNRAEESFLPTVNVLDMRGEKKQNYFDGPFSPKLLDAIHHRLDQNQGVILLQNRRGFSNYVECNHCGWVDQCPNCSVTLTFHKMTREMRCHYCGYSNKPKDQCPKCHSHVLNPVGAGTQQLEDILRGKFPEANILRMDQDSISNKSSHIKILKSFRNTPKSILLGTQMIAKGLDFHHVTLVGVVGADTGLLMVDFRAAERTYQLLSQVAGRSGRGKLPGEVIIQTYHADHPIFNYVIHHDFEGFYQSQINERMELMYPPFSRLVVIEVKSKEKNEAENNIKWVYNKLLDFFPEQDMKGPAEPVIDKVGGWFRQQVFVFIPKEISIAAKYHSFFNGLQKDARELWKNTSRLIVDVDYQ